MQHRTSLRVVAGHTYPCDASLYRIASSVAIYVYTSWLFLCRFACTVRISIKNAGNTELWPWCKIQLPTAFPREQKSIKKHGPKASFLSTSSHNSYLITSLSLPRSCKFPSVTTSVTPLTAFLHQKCPLVNRLSTLPMLWPTSPLNKKSSSKLPSSSSTALFDCSFRHKIVDPHTLQKPRWQPLEAEYSV